MANSKPGTEPDFRITSPIAQLRWRCRRGMKELDLLLVRWLDTRYAVGSRAEQAAFRHFLELPDPELARYLLMHEQSPDAERCALAAAILSVRSPAA
jgi:antitoxin CptB